MSTTFAFGPHPHQKVEVEIFKYEQPFDASDNFDKNWLTAQISVMAGSFRAREQISILAWELERFLEELERLHKKLSGVAKFETMEEQLKLHLQGDGRGHIELSGRISSPHPNPNVLKFHFDVDQTDLAQTISQLKATVAKFPSR